MDRQEAVPRIRARGLRAAVGLALVLILGSVGAASPAGAAPFRRACNAPSPGHAACMAERLLLGAAAPATLSASPNRAASIQNNKPFPGFLTPQRLHEAYGLPTETAEAATQTVAVVDAFDDPTAEADLAVYDKQFGLPECTTANGCFKKVDQEGKASPLPVEEGGWATEISIDVQMVRAVCQSCHILLVEANSEEFSDLGQGVNAAANAGATEISNSYGGPEEGAYVALNTADYNHPGTVVLASSGDCGYVNRACPELASAANFPADSPDVVAVGGTSLTEVSGVWKSTTWNEGGSGCSTLFNAGPWQSEESGFSATGCGSYRGIADVSAIGDPNTGVDIYDSTPEFPGEKAGWGVWGGTSVAAPIVAAEFALAGGAQKVSYPASTLYSHSGEASALYDVVSGSNGKCAGATICSAVSGYDGPTGVGSPIGLEAFAISGSPKSTSPPTISGDLEQGQTLTESHGGWTGAPSSYSYQWERCGAGGKGCLSISGANSQSYLLTGADLGLTIRVGETAHNTTGNGSADSPVTGVITSDVPSVSSFTPARGITGSTVTITGTALDTATQVILGKLPAVFVVLSATTLEATVPDGGASSKVSVTTAHGTATGKGKFTVTFAVKSLKPLAGAPGTVVTIKGTGFNSSSKVSFAGTPAVVSTVSKSKLKATVPAGAVAGAVTVTNTLAPVGTVKSAATFTP